MQGEGGYNVAPREFFLPLLDFCREQKIPIWLDEVQTFTRTGQFFAFETLGLGEYVDVCTIAKTAQNGATFYTEEMNPKPGLISGTFSGATAALTAGLEILNMLDKENYMGPNGKVMQIHKEFIGMLNELNETSCKGLLHDAGGMGLMVAVTPFDGSKEKVEKLMHTLFKNGLICFTCGRGTYRLRFLIPAVTTTADIAAAKQILEKSILELA
jgi:acetylornithine/N-succinyldiaminopimelate aminotransferase